MEADGQQLWRLLRPTVRAAGPLKILRRMGPDGYLHDRIAEVVEQWGAKAVLKRLRLDAASADEVDAAWEALADLATPGKRLSRLPREDADRVALKLLDECARLPEDNPGALLADSVIRAIGTQLATNEFDSGIPGSGQVLSAWRVGNRIFVTDEMGAFAVYRTLDAVLAWWVREWDLVDIRCRGLKVSAITALGLVRDDDESGDSWIRINGRVWTRRDASAGP